MRVYPSLLIPLLLAATAVAETFVWVDESGATHMTDDPDKAPAEVREARHDPAHGGTWEGPLGDARLPGAPTARDNAEARTQRLLHGAVEDLQRGEIARAAVALDGILREQPTRPEPHWYLALLERHRGRYDSAEAHLRAFLASAGDDLDAWRASAQRRIADLEDERRLADESASGDPERWRGIESAHFRIALDPDLETTSPDYARTVIEYLENARASVVTRLGAAPHEAMGIVFYGRGSYDREHRSRFSFRTVGFFDGRIHVVSAAHPASELRALLFHEYVHAIFREHTGGDRPYWWNEGLAELSERAARQQPALTRSDRSALRRRIDADDWISLRRLAPSFSGLDDDDARAAYLEATAAALWVETRSDRDQRARMLTLLGTGSSDDAVFTEVLGMNTDAIDQAVQTWIRNEFSPRTAKATH